MSTDDKKSVWPMDIGDVMRITLEAILLPGGGAAPITVGEIKKMAPDRYDVQLQVFEFNLDQARNDGELTATSFTGRPTRIWRETTVNIGKNAQSPWVILRHALNAALRPQPVDSILLSLETQNERLLAALREICDRAIPTKGSSMMFVPYECIATALATVKSAKEEMT